MKTFTVALGIAAWVGVAGLAWGMASWDKPVWGFFPIVAGVLGAWLIGEYVTQVLWQHEEAKR